MKVNWTMFQVNWTVAASSWELTVAVAFRLVPGLELENKCNKMILPVYNL
jgi:hypothetical protein